MFAQLFRHAQDVIEEQFSSGVKLVWFCWVLWQINHCRLFNAKSSLYIYIKYIGFGFVGFYGISTIVVYLMSNTL